MSKQSVVLWCHQHGEDEDRSGKSLAGPDARCIIECLIDRPAGCQTEGATHTPVSMAAPPAAQASWKLPPNALHTASSTKYVVLTRDSLTNLTFNDVHSI